jgi:hypothetical protein
VRAEEKEVDGSELAREERLQETELESEEEEEVPELVEEEARALATGQRELLFEAMRAIMERRTFVVNDLALPAHEKLALEAFKAAVDGRDAKLGKFLYAEDRAALLEQALAVLQPNFTYDSQDLLVMIAKVGTLRAKLTNLGDAQDELMDANAQVGIVKADDDKDDDEAEDGEKKSTLSEGPEVVEEKKPSMFDEDAEAQPTPQPQPKPKPQPKQEPKPQPQPQADAEPAAEAAAEGEAEAKDGDKKKPWWRRPFG